MDFKEKYHFQHRVAESNRIIQKYPERIPVICQRGKYAGKLCPNLDKTKYLIPTDLTMGQFIWVIRNRLKISSNIGLYLFVNGGVQPVGYLIKNIYSQHKDEDGFLYVYYNIENTFG